MSALELPGYGTATTPDYPPEPACAVCRRDGIEIDEWGMCSSCAPREEETCSEYAVRLREIRKATPRPCSCTAPLQRARRLRRGDMQGARLRVARGVRR